MNFLSKPNIYENLLFYLFIFSDDLEEGYTPELSEKYHVTSDYTER